MKTRNRLFAILFVLVLALAAACDDDTDSTYNPGSQPAEDVATSDDVMAEPDLEYEGGEDASGEDLDEPEEDVESQDQDEADVDEWPFVDVWMGDDVEDGEVEEGAEEIEPEPEGEPEPNDADFFGFTHHGSDGNRYVPGKGNVPGASLMEVDIGATPAWVVGVPVESGALWVVVDEQGEAYAYKLTEFEWKQVPLTPDMLPPSAPPLLHLMDDAPILVAPEANASQVTHPLCLPERMSKVYVAENLDLVELGVDGTEVRLEANLLPDARMLDNGQGQLLALGDPTNWYAHGVLGDELEAQTLKLFDTNDEMAQAQEIPIPEGWVAEGIAPIWADMTGDGVDDIIVTQSNDEVGSRVALYDPAKSKWKSGPAIGTGYRWRHPLAVAPLGPDGEIELVVVRTPHIGGIVEFYGAFGDQLELTAQIAGYSSHVMGSRNLDMGIAGDFDGDGQVEIVVPTQAMDELAGIERPGFWKAEEAWRVPLDGTLTTNLAAASYQGKLVLAAGTSSGRLRIWMP